MTCEDVRPRLPELAEGWPRPTDEARAHLAACEACSAELARYQALLAALPELRMDVVDPPEGFLGRVLAGIPEQARWWSLGRLASNRQVHRAALSVGGILVGATAIGLLWWRATRRGLAPEAEIQAP